MAKVGGPIHTFELELLRAADETPFGPPSDVVGYCRSSGLRTKVYRRNPADTGQWVVIIAAATPFGIAVVRGIAAVLSAWLKARLGRKVRVKTNGREIEAKDAQEIREILSALAKYNNCELNILSGEQKNAKRIPRRKRT